MKKSFLLISLLLTLMLSSISVFASEKNKEDYQTEFSVTEVRIDETKVYNEKDDLLFTFEKVDEIVYTTTGLNIRVVPTTNSKRFGVYWEGTAVHRIGISKVGWSVVEIDGNKYFMWDDYLTTEAPEYISTSNSSSTSSNSNLTCSCEIAGSSTGDYQGQWYITGYTSDPAENGGYSTDCLGRELIPWYTCASSLPLGTKVYVEGLGTFEVRDRGVSGNHLDICTNSNSESYGITGYYNVYIVN